MTLRLATCLLIGLLAAPLGGCLSNGPGRTALFGAPDRAPARTVRVPSALASSGANAPGTLILGIQ